MDLSERSTFLILVAFVAPLIGFGLVGNFIDCNTILKQFHFRCLFSFAQWQLVASGMATREQGLTLP